MRSKWQMVVLLAGLGLAFAASAGSSDISGVLVEDTLDMRGSKLVLNGAGIRHKAIFKVYVASLYLSKKSSTTEEALAAPGSKRISLTMLRDIDATELGKLFTRGLEDNMPKNEFSKMIPSILRMSQIFSENKNLKAGDNISMDYVAGVGTVLAIKGKALGEPFKEPEFFKSLMLIWLGNNPADWKLKESLLGKS